jgi:type VI secretion system secreted protein VgrG
MKSIVLSFQPYEVKLAPHPAPFSLLNCMDHDAVGQVYRYEGNFTALMDAPSGTK